MLSFTKGIVSAGALLVLFALAPIATAQGESSGPSLRNQLADWGPLEWIGVGSILVTLGINIEQNRRTRVDVKGLVSKIDAFEDWRRDDLPDAYVRRDYWKEKIESIEHGIRAIDRRAGALEKHLAFTRHEDREERQRDRDRNKT